MTTYRIDLKYRHADGWMPLRSGITTEAEAEAIFAATPRRERCRLVRVDETVLDETPKEVRP